eukprot:gb/GECG01012968.1/.p1 GENE.gb/GECG01012968.1/~~gb/GECG01012968.1/.p1  ORF type:complete len:528 (+),score=89.38 gb/GECG01012968.1/:1-1584(+)
MSAENSTPANALPVRIEGPVGQSYAVWETYWTCTSCQADNKPTRPTCYRCREAKPANSSKVVFTPPTTSSGELKWKEAFDPVTQQIYYYNTETRETQWTRPTDLGPAPHATGWFGRGAADHDLQAEFAAKNEKWLQRPAKKQADIDLSKQGYKEGAHEYNIWYHKWVGEHWTERLQKGEPAPTRCHIDEDAGYTKASLQKNEKCYFCLHFARGGCARGSDCTFYHHLPGPNDEVQLENTRDIFGRERYEAHRDDMGGVGSYRDESRTLYISGFSMAGLTDKQMEAILWRHFGEWGEIENVNVIARLSIAFVRYRCRVNAEFAKEAMYHQPLDNQEILNVRWARDDPNPVAKESKKRADEDAFILAMQAKGYAMVDVDKFNTVSNPTAENNQIADGSTNGSGAAGGQDANSGENGGGNQGQSHESVAGEEVQKQIDYEQWQQQMYEYYKQWWEYQQKLQQQQQQPQDGTENGEAQQTSTSGDPQSKLESLLNTIDSSEEEQSGGKKRTRDESQASSANTDSASKKAAK